MHYSLRSFSYKLVGNVQKVKTMILFGWGDVGWGWHLWLSDCEDFFLLLNT